MERFVVHPFEARIFRRWIITGRHAFPKEAENLQQTAGRQWRHMRPGRKIKLQEERQRLAVRRRGVWRLGGPRQSAANAACKAGWRRLIRVRVQQACRAHCGGDSRLPGAERRVQRGRHKCCLERVERRDSFQDARPALVARGEGWDLIFALPKISSGCSAGR